MVDPMVDVLANDPSTEEVHSLLRRPMSLGEICLEIAQTRAVADPVLPRQVKPVLRFLEREGLVVRSGKTRGTKYLRSDHVSFV